jgi:cobalt-zinc-cadmium efflux system protein
MSGHAHDHPTSPEADRRWLGAALALLVVFLVGEVVAGLLSGSLALIADAGHMLTDAAALAAAIVAGRIAQRPARGRYTYGFARVDALSGQANGITLVLLAIWFTVTGIRRLVHPPAVHGGVVAAVAVVGLAVNAITLLLARRADRRSLNVRGVVAHLASDVWAFTATLTAGVVILVTGWTRADPIASLAVAAAMVVTGSSLIRQAGRVFLEAAPEGVDPLLLGAELAATEGVAQVHDLHVWQIGSGEVAASAHVLVRAPYDCHEVSERLRVVLAEQYGVGHATLQADHADAATHDAGSCADAHGEVHVAPPEHEAIASSE